MKREIKFRAWDEVSETMYYSDSGNDDHIILLEPTGITLQVYEIVDRLTENGHQQELDWVYRHNAHFMQYTGFKESKQRKKYQDKQEIYEGDRVRGKKYYGDVITGVVQLWNGCFVVVWESVVGAYGEKATHSMYLKECEDIEVIGNIYEDGEGS